MIAKKKPQWKTFEESALHTSSKIFSKEIVQANQRVQGIVSGGLRQIDVKVGESSFIDIECKDHKEPVDVTIVEQFAGKLKDEDAKGGIIVSNSGFTQPALRTAEYYNIKPVVLVDKGHANSSNFILRVPVAARGLYVDGIRYGVSQKSGQQFALSPLIWNMKAAETRDKPRNLYEVFRDAWNNSDYPIEGPGTYELRFDNAPIYDLDNRLVRFNVTFVYVVKEDVRLGYMGASKARGMFDINKGIFTSAEDIEFEPIEIQGIDEWDRVKPGDKIPNSTLSLIGVVPLPDTPPLEHYRNQFTGELMDPKEINS